jgi:hypothetical protein
LTLTGLAHCSPSGASGKHTASIVSFDLLGSLFDSEAGGEMFFRNSVQRYRPEGCSLNEGSVPAFVQHGMSANAEKMACQRFAQNGVY